MVSPRSSEFYSGSSSSESSDSITTIIEDEEAAFNREISCSFSPPDSLDFDIYDQPERRITVEDVDVFQGYVDQLDLVEDRIMEAKENYAKARAIYELLYDNDPIRPVCEEETACDPIVEITEEEENVINSMRRAQLGALKEYKVLIQELRNKRLEIIEDLKLTIRGRRSSFLTYFEGIEAGLVQRLETARRRHRLSRNSSLKQTYEKVKRNLALLRETLLF